MPFFFFLLLCLSFSPWDLKGEENETLVVECTDGDTVSISLTEESKFLAVIEQIISSSKLDDEDIPDEMIHPGYFAKSSLYWNFTLSYAGGNIVAKKGEKKWRDYWAVVSKDEKADITYIIRTLAYESLISIGGKRSSLKKAGDRIDHIHPLRFLMTVFQEEELKAGIAAIRGQTSWVKDGFFDGLIGSLKEEGGKDNLISFSDHFSKTLNIPSKSVNTYLQKGNHKEFIDYLIDTIPRQNDPNRYNM